MKKFLFIFSLVLLSNFAFAEDNQTKGGFITENIESVEPVMCSKNSIIPIMVAENEYPCPGEVYCEHYRCGEPFCCPWGYFYSNPCTCLCYKTSYDAGSDCDTYFRCN